MHRSPAVSLLLVFVFLLPSPSRADEPPLSPSMQAYKDVSVAREKYGDVIWGDKSASPAELHQIVDELHGSLKMLDEPLDHDLAEGNLYLHYRRFNILIDLVKLYARLGDKEQAFQAWRELSLMDWSPMTTALFAKDPNVKKLMLDPDFAGIDRPAQVAGWWSGARAFKTPFKTELTEQERVAGLSRVWSVARDGFVWFDHVPQLNWDQAYLEYLPRVVKAKSTEDYYRELIKFVALLHDGHSNVYYPDELQDKFYSRPGLRTRLIDGKVIVTDITDASLKKSGLALGDELVDIDDVPVKQYAYDRVVPFESSSTSQDRDVRAFNYGLLSGDAHVPVKLLLRDAQGKPYTLIAARSGYATSKEPGSSDLFRLTDDGIAILRASQFENDSALKALEANMKSLLGAKGLVLDLRGNGGGSSNNGLDILTYLSANAIPTTLSSYRDNNALDLAQGGSPSIRWREVERSPGRIERKAIYAGPVVMLIDARTFSAGEDTAAAFKLMHRGKIIGMPSGGSTGQPLMLDLPGGGVARICVKRDRYPDGSDFVGIGVLPDESADITVSDVRGGGDSVLAKAIDVLKQEANGQQKGG